MNIAALDPMTRNDLVQQYQLEGYAIVPAVRLPDCFQPHVSEVVFMSVQGRCEVYVGAHVAYRGGTKRLRRLFERPAAAGGARLLISVRGDALTGAQALAQVFRQEQGTLDRTGSTARGLAPAPSDVLAGLPPMPELRDTDVPLPEPDSSPSEAVSRDGAAAQMIDLVERAHLQPREYAGRGEILHTLKTSLLRETKPGVLLTGPPGCGKTTIVQMLARDIAQARDLPLPLRGTHLFELPIGALLENAHMVGDLEREARRVFGLPGRPIIFLDEIHQLARPELAPLRDLLKPALADGAIRLIGVTTPLEWRLVKDSAFKRRFMELTVAEPSLSETAEMLSARCRSLELHHGLTLEPSIVRESIVLADRHLTARHFPDKAIDLLDQAASRQLAAPPLDGEPCRASSLQREHLHTALAAWSGLGLDLLSPEGHAGLLQATHRCLASSLKGQTTPISKLIDTLQGRLTMRYIGWERAIDDLRTDADRRPLACVLACGPTGVGKSETARLLAKQFYGGRLVVLNASDVGPEAPHGTSSWVGSPKGFVGSDEGGILTNALRSNPAAVILIDELEKASPDAVQNVLLPLLGDGSVTDRNTGETLWARDCVVFCTTNLMPQGASTGHVGYKTQGEGPNAAADVFESLSRWLRKEVIARFNAVLLYDHLDLSAQWQVWSELRHDLEDRLGGGARILLDDNARRLVQDRFKRIETGARGIQEFFRETIVCLAATTAAGKEARIGVDGGRLVLLGESDGERSPGPNGRDQNADPMEACGPGSSANSAAQECE